MNTSDVLNSANHMSKSRFWTKKYTWKNLLFITHRNRVALLEANVVAILAALAAVPSPLLIPLIVDEVLLNRPGFFLQTINRLLPEYLQKPLTYLALIGIMGAALKVVNLVMDISQYNKFVIISKEISHHLRLRLLYALNGVAINEYNKIGNSGISTRILKDVDAIEDFINASTSKIVVSSVFLIGAFIALFSIHWKLAICIITINPAVIYIASRLGNNVGEARVYENTIYDKFLSLLSDTLDSYRQLKLTNRLAYYTSKLASCSKEYKAASYAFKADSYKTVQFSLFVLQLGIDVFRIGGLFLVINSDLTIGMMFAVFSYLFLISAPIYDLLIAHRTYCEARESLARINHFFELEGEELLTGGENNPFNEDSISVSIKGLSFSYVKELPLLNRIDMCVGNRKSIAIVGKSGSGKSTLVQLLLGAYSFPEGSIRYGGVVIENIGRDALRENVVAVFQEAYFFDGSIRSNLCMGGNFTDSQLWNALEIAQLKDYVTSLEEQLDAPVGHKGGHLSRGQQQRLAIARMILRDPRIVILDEATSALDAETESLLWNSLQFFLKYRISIIITHKVSAIKWVDHIYVVDNGSIVNEEYCDPRILPAIA